MILLRNEAPGSYLRTSVAERLQLLLLLLLLLLSAFKDTEYWGETCTRSGG